MAFGAHTPWSVRLVALALAGVLALLAAGAAADRAEAGSPCAKYGEVRAEKLRNRQARASIRCFHNREREQRGLSKLNKDKRLQRASQKHTEIMVKKKCF